MKVKTLACLCALAAVPAFGTVAVESANEFGVLKVSCAAQKVIIATPWVECLTAGNVSVTDLVMTSGLSDGDAILVHQSGNNFKCWTISSGAWVGATVVLSNAVVSSGNAESAAIARGKAFWFVKSDYTSGSYDLYLYGQDTSAAATSAIAGGSSSSPAYSLVASPKTTVANLNSDVTFSVTPGAADEIRIPRAGLPDVIYTYKDGAWGTPQKVETYEGSGVYKRKWQAGCTISAGTGFWYVNKSAARTITWN